MAPERARRQRGQAIVLIAFMIVVLFGFLGLAIDGGRAYVDRRELQAATDAGALAAAYNYMNNSDYALAEQAATASYATNEGLYATPTCSGYGTLSVSCSFADPSGQTLIETVVNGGIVGVTFTLKGRHSIPVAIMQVLGSGPTVGISATATAMARRFGSNGAAILTLSPVCSGGNASMTFTGTSKTTVTGDIWSDGGIVDSGGAGGTINGNAIDICPAQPPVPLPAANWTVTGTQANGWNMPDPNYPEPPLNVNPETWISTNGSTQVPGTYSSNVSLTGNNCYFVDGGVYDFANGFKLNGGFVSNELRPPDEPALVGTNPYTTATSANLSGTITSIPVTSLPAGIAGSTSQHSSYVSVGGQSFVVATSGAASGATSIPLNGNTQTVSGTIPSGSTLTVRAYNQFWDANQSSPDASGCSGAFTPSAVGSDTNNPPVSAQSWSLELTAVRWEPNNGLASCTGPTSPSCYLRESAPSMCKTITTATNQVMQIQVAGITSPPAPGVTSFNVYLAPNGSCTGPFGYLTNFADSGSFATKINGNTLSGWNLAAAAQPPAGEVAPLAPGLPNANPAPGNDVGNEGHCVDPTTGNIEPCAASAFTPGAVTFFIPGPGSTTQCLNLQGGGDIYLFSGYQYSRVLTYEPGPEQAPPPNTCADNIAGGGLTSLIGILYMPAANVTIIGNSSYLATIAGGVVAWTCSVQGNGGVSISADPTLRRWPPTVRLTN